MNYGVGIDISKGKSTVAIVTGFGEVIEEPFEIFHNKQGFLLLEDKLKLLPKENVKIVMEATGNYHLPVLRYLVDRKYFVSAENALKIKKYFDRDLRKVKTDKKDSLKLAEYCYNNWNELIKIKECNEIYDNLKFLSRQYFNQTAIKVKEKIVFSNLCDLIFPGYYQLLNENNFILGLTIIKKYCHPDLIQNKKQSTFINEIDKMAKKLGHRTAGITLAKKIYELSNKTISPYPNSEYIQLSVNSCVDALILTIKTTNIIISKMNKLASELPEYQTIKSMSGIGEKLAPRIIAEIGDVRRFKNASSIIAYAGLDAPPYQSGQFEANNRHISKRGSKYLRKTGYEIMQAIKINGTSDDEMYNYIIKKELEGKAKKVAKIAGLNKFLRIYYGTVKRIYKDLEIW